MKVNLLKAKMSAADIKVEELVEAVNNQGVPFSRAGYFRKVNGDTEFSRREILAIAKVLDMTSDEMVSIFFAA